MTDYIMKHTDPANASFAVKPYTVDGYITPAGALYTNVLSGISAVSAHTCLALTGKGVPEYGELVQNNLIFLTEHFAFATRPHNPMQGQIWYKNASVSDPANPTDPVTIGLYLYDGAWNEIVINGGITGNLDMSGFQINNLGAPSLPTDALNLGTADSLYFPFTGGIITGTTTFTAPVTFNSTVSTATAPSVGNDITNKTYVDTVAATLQGNITALSLQLPNYVLKSGDSMSGTLTLGTNASLILGAGGSGTVNMGARVVQSVAAPVANTDATNKVYVDTAISTAIAAIPPAGPGTSDGVVYAGNLNIVTGTLTLNRTMSLPDVIIAGTFAPFSHTHAANTLTYDMTTPYSQSYLASALQDEPTFPTPSVYDAIRTLDRAAYDSDRRIRRVVVAATGASTYNMNFAGSNMLYEVNTNKLQVHVQGLKKYANDRGFFTLVFVPPPAFPNTTVSPRVDVGLSAGSYSFTITVSGTPYLVTLSVPAAPYTFLQLAQDIQDYMDTNTIPATIRFEEFFDLSGSSSDLSMVFSNKASGAGSAVTVSTNPGELFTSITYFTDGPNITYTAPSTTTRDYLEVGNPGDLSSQITFASPPTIGDMIEFLIFP